MEANGGAVASEERSALLGFPSVVEESSAENAATETGEATQQLLTCLGRFQREVSNAQDDAQGGLWADECMDQLIACVEVALPHGWPEIVEAVTDAGRVLQTHVEAGRATDCVDFLNDAYEILCLMVGDLIVDSIRPSVVEQWRDRYLQAVADLESGGLVLISDDAPASAPVSNEIPFQLPESQTNGAPSTTDDALPTLDELPPLDDVLGGDAPAAPAAETASESPAEPEPEESNPAEPAVATSGPSRLAVQIMDQLCEQLSAYERGSGSARDLALERFEGGVRALQREARGSDHEMAAELCTLMLKATNLIPGRDDAAQGRFAETGYAFCGAYMDALNEDAGETAAAWQVECTSLVGEWENTAESAASEADAEPDAPTDLLDTAEAVFGDVEETPEPDTSVTEDVEDVAETIPETSEPEASTGAEESPAEPAAEIVQFPTAVSMANDETATPASPESAPTESSEPVAPEAPEPSVPDVPETIDVADTEPDSEADHSSSGLLASAQRAATDGDPAAAKRLALQAAASIARDEAEAAKRSLERTQERLKASLDATQLAREGVKEAEESVAEAAASVHEEQSSLGQCKERSASVEQKLEDLREDVEDIERQIAELQARREAELQRVAETETDLSEARKSVANSETELERLRSEEDAARADLESRRQNVNDLQRTNSDIEGDVKDVQEDLSVKTKSFEDIAEAVRHICGDDATESNEELLF